MFSLVQQSEQYTKWAGELLASSGLMEVLKKYGAVKFVGSYAGGVMMHGDIDIHVLREKPFSKEETLAIFTDIARATKFNSYYIGDWNDTNLHPEFPEGYYIGLKTVFAGEKWKIDAWFVSKAEQERCDRTRFDIAKANLSPEQKETILSFKKYRNEHAIKISGQRIYEMVLKENVRTLAEFEKTLKEAL